MLHMPLHPNHDDLREERIPATARDDGARGGGPPNNALRYKRSETDISPSPSRPRSCFPDSSRSFAILAAGCGPSRQAASPRRHIPAGTGRDYCRPRDAATSGAACFGSRSEGRAQPIPVWGARSFRPARLKGPSQPSWREAEPSCRAC